MDGSTVREAQLEAVQGSCAFIPEDGPMQLARLIEKFFDENARGPREGVHPGD